MKQGGLSLFTAGLIFSAQRWKSTRRFPAYAPAPVGAAVIKSVGSDT
jgi:hypothetical protein